MGCRGFAASGSGSSGARTSRDSYRMCQDLVILILRLTLLLHEPGNILGLLAPSTSTSGDAGLEVTLQEIDPRSGAIVQSIPLPSADTATGYGLRVDTSFSSGALVRTDDGCNVLLSGYGTSATPGAGVVLENDASVPRTVAVISSGAIDTSTRSWTFAWQASWMPLGGQCRQATDDLGAQPRDAVMLPSGGIILTGKAGAQLPMTRGFDYNVSRFNAATGPFSPLFLDLYNRQSCNGSNTRAAYLYRNRLLVASSGSTGPTSGVTIYPDSLTTPRTFTAWPPATLPTAAYGGASPNGVVQVDDSTILVSDNQYGVVTWRLTAGGLWAVASVDNWLAAAGSNNGTNKISVETSTGTTRVYVTNLPGVRGVTSIFELLPAGTGPARFRMIITSAAGFHYRAVAGVPTCSPLPAPSAPPRPPAPSARPFTAGNILALVAPAAVAAADAGFNLTLQELDPRTGNLLQSVPLPPTDGAAAYGLRIGPSFSEGALVRSDDGCTVTLSGYGVSSLPPPGVVLENDPTSPRVVAVITADGGIDISTRSWVMAWMASYMPVGGQCGQPGDDRGASPRDAVVMPGGAIILTGKPGIQMPMVRGGDYNVSRFRAGGPFDSLWVSSYSSQSCAGPNVRAAYMYRGNLLIASSGSTGPSSGVTIYPGSLTQPRTFATWPSATLPTSAYGGASPNGVVQVDDGTILVSDNQFGVVTWRLSGGTWRVTSVDNWNVTTGGNWGTNKISIDTAFSPPRVYVTNLPGNRGFTTVFEFLLSSTPEYGGPARFRAIATSAPGTHIRAVAGVPNCSPLPAPAPPAGTSTGPSAAALGGGIGGGVAAVILLGVAAAFACRGPRCCGGGAGTVGSPSSPSRKGGDPAARGVRVDQMAHALSVSSLTAAAGASPSPGGGVRNPLADAGAPRV